MPVRCSLLSKKFFYQNQTAQRCMRVHWKLCLRKKNRLYTGQLKKKIEIDTILFKIY